MRMSCKFSNKQFSTPIIFALFVTLNASEAIDCYQQSAVSGVAYNVYNNLFTCPPTVEHCYKYVCIGSVYYVQKGCLDPTSPIQNCQVIQGQCQAQGGSGTCYTCDADRCNGSSTEKNFKIISTLLVILAGAFLALIMPM